MMIRRLAGAGIVVMLALALVPRASAADMPYTLAEFGSAFLTDADIQALAPWGSLVPDTPKGQECSAQASGGFICTRTYPISLYGYSRPHVLSARSYPDPRSAETAFTQLLGENKAKAVNVLSASPTDFSIEWRPDADHRVVTSARLDRNNVVEASCSGRLTPGPPVADVNTCTQLMLNAQLPRLAPFESPKIVPPDAPVGVLSSVKGNSATVTWLPPENSGGAPITHYTATSTDGGLSCSAAPTTEVVQTCIASGAKAGVTYSFTVTAANIKGASSASAPSKPSRFTARSSAPRNAKARVNGTSAVVTWQRPLELGGLRVERYAVTSVPGGVTCVSRTTACTVSGLAYATKYRFVVRAINARGASAPGATIAVRTPNPPPPPPLPTPEPVATDKPTAELT